jgi:uncharacterized protein
MKCPRCENSALDEREREGVTIDVCPACRGIWLDRSELERIVARALSEQEQSERPEPPSRAGGGQAPPPGYAPAPGHGDPRGPGGYYHRDDDTPPPGYRRDHDRGSYRQHRKKHWFESLTDIFD